MIFRETGQFHVNYEQDQGLLPLREDRWFVVAALLVAFVAVPLLASEYWLQAVLIPFVIFAIAAVGLNLLTGYAGQVSLGTGAFMAVGGYATYKITTTFPDLNILVVFLLAGLIAAAVGIVFGLPSLRIKGFYLAVATLAAQFFIQWLFNKVGWFYNDNPSGTISAPPRTVFGIMVTGPAATATVRYLVALGFLTLMALAGRNLVRGRIGRAWMAIRDMDIAAEIIGIRPLQTKLLAFAISSFYCGVAGAMVLCLYLNTLETEAYSITISFEVLFMIIIGGLGSILGSIIGAAFITLTPVMLKNLPEMLGIPIGTDTSQHLVEIIFGGLIVLFLILEPNGMARLWQIFKEKLRRWPFPY